MNKLTYKIEGLDCSNCALKIQERLNELPGVEKAEVVFSTQKLNLEIKEQEDSSLIFQTLQNEILKLEPEVKIVEGSPSPNKLKEGSRIITQENLILFIGTLLFFLGVWLKLSFYLELTLFAVSYVLVGKNVLKKSFYNIKKGQVFDENFLMSIATLGAFAINEFSEAVAVMIFYKVGEIFEGIAVNKSRRSIQSLMDLKAQFANLFTSEGLKQVDPATVKIGDLILIKPGEKIPLDGMVVEGRSSADTSAITGEFTPRSIQSGDLVYSGFINHSGSLTVQTTTTFSNSTVSKILDLVENAASKKAPTENFITKFARYYTPGVVILALCIGLFPPIVSGSFDFSLWLYRALIFLVVSCPCALVISIPLTYFGGIGGASRRGILIKGGNFLDALNSVGTVVFDKTGTLTHGVFDVVEIVPKNGFSKEALLEYAAYCESFSTHPIAKSIVTAFIGEVDPNRIENFQELPGLGVKGLIYGKEVLAGNEKFLTLNCEIDPDMKKVQGTVVHVSVDRMYAGYLLISDKLKNDAHTTMNALKNSFGKRVVMLTGDHNDSAAYVARELDIDEFYSGLLPGQKVEKLEELKRESPNSKLIFVGDGINDAPVLALSDIGISMGGLGSDAAIEASDVVFMTDEPSKLLEAFKIAKKTRGIVLQNIFFSLFVKALVMLLASFGVATMWEAVFADVGVTLIAVLNSMRIIFKRGKTEN